MVQVRPDTVVSTTKGSITFQNNTVINISVFSLVLRLHIFCFLPDPLSCEDDEQGKYYVLCIHSHHTSKSSSSTYKMQHISVFQIIQTDCLCVGISF